MRLWPFIIVFGFASFAHGALQKLVMDGDHDPVSNLTFKIGSGSTAGGKVFLDVTLSGAGVTAANDRAWLYGPADAPRMLYREGDLIPGYSLAKISFVNGSLGPTGWFGASIQDSAFDSVSSVVGDGTTMRLVAQRGQPAPGTDEVFDIARPSAVRSDHEFDLLAYLDPTASPNPIAYYRARNDGSLQLLTVSGQAMPQLSSENLTRMILEQLDSSSYSMWTLAYNAPGYPYGETRRGLFLSRDTGTTLLLKDGDPQPVSPPLGAYGAGPLWLGKDGSYVFQSGFLSTDNHFYGIGLYAGDENSYQLRRLPGQVVTDQPSSYQFNSIGAHASSADGQIAMIAGLHDYSANAGMSVIAMGNVNAGFRTLARTGTAAPGLSGLAFKSFGNSSLAGLWMNDSDDVAFLAWLDGSAIDSTNDSSLWAYHQGEIQLLAREGDLLTVDGITRTIGSLEYVAPSFDPEGDLILPITFTDGTRGYFLAQVPEPASSAAVILVVCSSLRRRRRAI